MRRAGVAAFAAASFLYNFRTQSSAQSRSQPAPSSNASLAQTPTQTPPDKKNGVYITTTMDDILVENVPPGGLQSFAGAA